MRKRISWHPGFYGGLELELREYRDLLEYEPEHTLSKEPLSIDMMIIKKRTGEVIDHPIGCFFKKYNVVEYKDPNEELSIDTFYKTIAYATLYKALGDSVDAIPIDELTISIFRHTYPRELMRALRVNGAGITEIEAGIYYVDGIINIPIQIVVTGRLKKGVYLPLRILTQNADTEEIRKFLKDAEDYDKPADRNDVNAVLNVSVSANTKIYSEIKEEADMEALRELFKDELAEAEARGEARGEAKGDSERKRLEDENLRLREENEHLRALVTA